MRYSAIGKKFRLKQAFSILILLRISKILQREEFDVLMPFDYPFKKIEHFIENLLFRSYG